VSRHHLSLSGNGGEIDAPVPAQQLIGHEFKESDFGL
jgi:hypothetical protein